MHVLPIVPSGAALGSGNVSPSFLDHLSAAPQPLSPTTTTATTTHSQPGKFILSVTPAALSAKDPQGATAQQTRMLLRALSSYHKANQKQQMLVMEFETVVEYMLLLRLVAQALRSEGKTHIVHAHTPGWLSVTYGWCASTQYASSCCLCSLFMGCIGP